VLALLAALAAIAPSAEAPATEAPATAAEPAEEVLESAVPWWKKITVTVDDQGEQQSCRYETSAAGAQACEPAMAASIGSGGKSAAGLYKKVTFERRFSPGGKLDAGKLHLGDTLLGRQVMYLTIDATGAIATCKVVETSGEARPDYGCAEAKKEKFSAGGDAGAAARQAFMTVLAYGHTEEIA
jgi:hypothetical protein